MEIQNTVEEKKKNNKNKKGRFGSRNRLTKFRNKEQINKIDKRFVEENLKIKQEILKGMELH